MFAGYAAKLVDERTLKVTFANGDNSIVTTLDITYDSECEGIQDVVVRRVLAIVTPHTLPRA